MFQKQVKLYFGLQIVCVLSHFYSFYRFIYVSMQRFDAKQLVSRTRTVPQQTKFKQIYDFSTYFFRVGSRPNTRKTFQIENAPFNLLSRIAEISHIQSTPFPIKNPPLQLSFQVSRDVKRPISKRLPPITILATTMHPTSPPEKPMLAVTSAGAFPSYTKRTRPA